MGGGKGFQKRGGKEPSRRMEKSGGRRSSDFEIKKRKGHRGTALRRI